MLSFFFFYWLQGRLWTTKFNRIRPATGCATQYPQRRPPRQAEPGMKQHRNDEPPAAGAGSGRVLPAPLGRPGLIPGGVAATCAMWKPEPSQPSQPSRARRASRGSRAEPADPEHPSRGRANPRLDRRLAKPERSFRNPTNAEKREFHIWRLPPFRLCFRSERGLRIWPADCES